MVINQFSIQAYKVLLKFLLKSNLVIRGFHDYSNHMRVVILRHDVDFCTSSALKIAQIENELNIKSIFFLLLNTNFYNLHSRKNYINVCKILDMGHNIGLHFDTSVYHKKECEVNCIKEVQALERLFGIKNKIISFHRPRKKLLNTNKKFAGYEHTYMSKFTKNMFYCSDSQGKWLFKRPENIIKKYINKSDFKMQLLTHPIWWNIQSYKTPHNKISSYLSKKYKDLQIEAANNCKSYKK